MSVFDVDATVRATQMCAFCPTLCMHACPVVTADGSDVTAPWGKMSLARWLALGKAKLDDEAAVALQACTECGACTDACAHAVPVGDTLRTARAAAVAAGVVVVPASAVAAPVDPDEAERRVLPEGTSGAKLLSAGHVERFRQVARAAGRRWRGREEWIFASAADVACVRNDWAAHGIEVTSPVSLDAGEIGAGATLNAPDAVYFEACHVARGDADTASRVRDNARAAASGALQELRWTGEAATCCGAGGAWKHTAPESARRAGERILDSALGKGAKTLLVGCAGCASHLRDCVGDREITVEALRTAG